MTSEDTPKRAAVYCRISKDDKGKEGVGLGPQRQQKECRQLAGRLGWDVAEVYTDNDITASGKKKRPRYIDLVADIRDRKVDAVLTWHTDRLHRSPVELEDYIKACGEGSDGVPTQTVKAGPIDLATPTGRLVARLLGAVARYELEHGVERINSALQQNRQAGAWKGGSRPFGFRIDGLSIKKGGEGRLAQVPKEAAAIRKAYATMLASDPENGLHTIAREWNRAGLRTARGETLTGEGNWWSAATVRHVLLRAYNAGLIEHDGKIVCGESGDPVVARWEPIVSPDTWRAVKAVLTDPKRQSGPGPKPRWLLTGVLICGVCGGRKFGVVPEGRRPRPVYRCVTLASAPDTETGGLKRFHLGRSANLLDAYVEDRIIGLLRRDEVRSALNTGPGIDLAALDARRTEINAELEEIAAARFTVRQKAIQSAPLLDELAEVERQVSEGLRGDPLPEFADSADPAEVWYGDEDKGIPPLPIERRRAAVAMLMRVKLSPTRRRIRPPGHRTGDPYLLDSSAVEILPPDA